jgi:hypothetical protein
MVKYFHLLLILCTLGLNKAQAQFTNTNSLFGLLHPFSNSLSPAPKANYEISISANKSPYLKNGAFSQVSISASKWGVLLNQTRWDQFLKKEEITLFAFCQINKRLLIRPGLSYSATKLEQIRLLQRISTSCYISYFLSKEWQLACLFDHAQKELQENSLNWQFACRFNPSSIFQIETDIARNAIGNAVNGLILLKWNASRHFSLCLGKSSLGTWVLAYQGTYKSTTIACKLTEHPLTGSSYNIGITKSLSFTRRD